MFSFNVDSYIQEYGSAFMQNYLNNPVVINDITNKLNMALDRGLPRGYSFPTGMRSITIDASGNMVITHDGTAVIKAIKSGAKPIPYKPKSKFR